MTLKKNATTLISRIDELLKNAISLYREREVSKKRESFKMEKMMMICNR